MKLHTEKVIVNNKKRERYYVNEQRCTKEQYLNLLKLTTEKQGKDDFGVDLLCKIKQCTKNWESLQLTSIDGIRFCDECKERVHMCQSWLEVEQLGRHGMCVAIRQPWSGVHVTLGVPII
jgi:hypothetical protein